MFSFLRHDVVVSRSPINLNPTLHNMTDNRLMKMSVFVYAADVSLQECEKVVQHSNWVRDWSLVKQRVMGSLQITLLILRLFVFCFFIPNSLHLFIIFSCFVTLDYFTADIWTDLEPETEAAKWHSVINSAINFIITTLLSL